MKNKVDSLKDVREQVRNLSPGDKGFSDELYALSEKVIPILDEINDQQEKNWIKKSQELLRRQKIANNKEEQDQALNYFKEALNSVILREENFLK